MSYDDDLPIEADLPDVFTEEDFKEQVEKRVFNGRLKISYGMYTIESLNNSDSGDALSVFSASDTFVGDNLNRIAKCYASKIVIGKSIRLINSVIQLVHEYMLLDNSILVLCGHPTLLKSADEFGDCILRTSKGKESRKKFVDAKIVFGQSHVIFPLLLNTRKVFDVVISTIPISAEEYLYDLLMRTDKELVFLLPKNSIMSTDCMRRVTKVCKDADFKPSEEISDFELVNENEPEISVQSSG